MHFGKTGQRSLRVQREFFVRAVRLLDQFNHAKQIHFNHELVIVPCVYGFHKGFVD